MAILGNMGKRKDAELEREWALWRSPATEKRLERGDPETMHTQETPDYIIRNPKRLKDCTGRTIGEFNYLAPPFNEQIDRTCNTPPFRDGGAGVRSRNHFAA